LRIDHLRVDPEPARGTNHLGARIDADDRAARRNELEGNL
jgi:hypothetical protein